MAREKASLAYAIVELCTYALGILDNVHVYNFYTEKQVKKDCT
jgi:hypothetical protein